MHELSKSERQRLLDHFGKRVIEHVRDVSLIISMDITKGTTANPIKREQYSNISNLSDMEKESICDLLSETITDTIYNFLDMFEAYANEMKLYVTNDKGEYDLCEISEKMGGEIAFQDDDGWIQKFSSVGRYIL